MPLDKPARRLPLRDLLTDAEKRTRDLIEHMGSTWLARSSDLRDLSRPVRKKSHFPTLIALRHSLEKLLQVNADTLVLVDQLQQELDMIREHARREQVTRR
jgi:hypothetical protein